MFCLTGFSSLKQSNRGDGGVALSKFSIRLCPRFFKIFSIVWRTLQNSSPLNAAPPRVAFSQHKQENHSSFLSTISTPWLVIFKGMSLSNPLKLKSSRKTCFFCGVNYQDENKRIGIFGVPKNKFSSWQLIIPELKQASLLCEKHFDESDVLKGFTDGTVYHPYGRWRLSISAVPQHFLGIKEASSKVVKRTPLKQLFSVNTQQKKRDGIQAKISSVHSMSNNHQNLPSPLGNGANRHKPLKRTVGTENTPPNQHKKKFKLISHQAPSRVSKSNTPFQSVALPTLQHPETEIIGGIDLMETDEPFNLPIETLTTVEEDTASCETTTAFQSAASPPHQEDESQLNDDNDHTETGEPFELSIDKETTVEEDTVSCDTTTTSKSVDSPTLQHPETEIIGGSELMETGEHFNLPIEAETTVEEETVSCDTTTTSKSVALPPQQDPETEIIAGRDLMETLKCENVSLSDFETYICLVIERK
ncbi:hypothetical protein OUZ56_026128 [Daphnia magna]|uniref:THAP-type domain-containing protein n=1 Tax=Daphnia magna TaxID=35525 RepID=A0ABQ9ZKV5_9CRUS|nr:hypothetical protein OUZ56_026128 [Daphnia magna]